MLRDLPITLGVITLPSSCCATSVMIHTQMNIVGLCIIAMTPAGTKAIQGPKKGIILATRSEEHTSELQSRFDLVCRLLLEKKKTKDTTRNRYRARITELSRDDYRYLG